MSPKQVVGFSCLFNSEVDQLIRKSLVYCREVPFLAGRPVVDGGISIGGKHLAHGDRTLAISAAILRPEKSFYGNLHEDFVKFSQIFSKFSRGFRSFQTRSDSFGPIGMHSDAFGSIWKRSDVSENFWNFLKFWIILECFGRNFYKQLFSRHSTHRMLLKNIRPPFGRSEKEDRGLNKNNTIKKLGTVPSSP